ncbi:MAG: hypothetical protein HKO07_03420, partial [Pseudomonadales bacterium]|nr:hypothetical protein [Pseudomonadales bacterium]
MSRFSLADKGIAAPFIALPFVCLLSTDAAAQAESSPPAALPQPVLRNTLLAGPPGLEQQLRQIDGLIANDELLEAELAAKQLIEDLLRVPPINQFGAALALDRLARVQQQSGDLTAAAQNFNAAIEYLSSSQD